MRNLSQQERQDAVNEIRLLASVQQNTAISGFHEAFIDGNRGGWGSNVVGSCSAEKKAELAAAQSDSTAGPA